MPNSQGRRVWSLARMNMNVKVKRDRDKPGKTAESSPLTIHCNVCAVRSKGAAGDGPFHGRQGLMGAHATASCVRCMLGKTCLDSCHTLHIHGWMHDSTALTGPQVIRVHRLLSQNYHTTMLKVIHII